MPNIFFTADTHFGHGRIIQYCNRPFSSHEEMDEVMMERFNSVLRPGDLLYHLGDVCWSNFPLIDKFFKRLNTKEVFLVKGNHDPRHIVKLRDWRRVWDQTDLVVGGKSFALSHYPMVTWKGRHYGGFHLYGHVHGKYVHPLRAMDVGVDNNNFYPHSFDQVVQELSMKPKLYPTETVAV